MSPVEAGEHKRTNQMTPTHLPFPSSVQINAQLRGSKEGVLENQHGTFVGQVQSHLEPPPPPPTGGVGGVWPSLLCKDDEKGKGKAPFERQRGPRFPTLKV
jgi:hypothetical protein